MARFPIRPTDIAGRPLLGASVSIYTEDSTKDNDEFTSSDLATVYSDETLTTEIDQPLTVGQTGVVECFIPSGSQVAIHVSRSSYGEKWERFVDVTGSDNA